MNALVKSNVPGLALRTVEDYQRFAQIAMASGAVALSKNGNAGLAEAVVKMARGAELGIPPMAALSGVHVVNGKTGLSANLMASLVDRSPRHDYAVDEMTNEACRISWHVDGKAKGQTHFLMEDAQAAGLMRNPTWKKYPRDMLFARAFSSGARKFCGSVLLGAIYTPDELSDGAVAADDAPEDVGVEVIDDKPKETVPGPEVPPGVTDEQLCEEFEAILDMEIKYTEMIEMLGQSLSGWGGREALDDAQRGAINGFCYGLPELNGDRRPSTVFAKNKAKLAAWNLAREFSPRLQEWEASIGGES